MRIASAAVLSLIAAATLPQQQRHVSSVVVSAYVPHHGGNNQRTGRSNQNDSSYSSRLGYRSSADTAYEETVQERIHRVRSGQMSEAEKQNFLNAALGNPLKKVDPSSSAPSSSSNTDTFSSSSGTTTTSTCTSSTTSGWSHPSYTPPRYITVPLNEKARADEKRKYLEMVMDPNRFKSYGNVGVAADAGTTTGTSSSTGGTRGSANAGIKSATNTNHMMESTTTANFAELNEVQNKIRQIEEEKRRMEADRVARDKVRQPACLIIKSFSFPNAVI